MQKQKDNRCNSNKAHFKTGELFLPTQHKILETKQKKQVLLPCLALVDIQEANLLASTEGMDNNRPLLIHILFPLTIQKGLHKIYVAARYKHGCFIARDLIDGDTVESCFTNLEDSL